MKNKFIYLLFFSILTGMSSCHSDEVVTEPTDIEKQSINFILDIPGLNLPSTYSMAGIKECEVKEVDIFVFKVDVSGSQTFIYHKTGTNIHNTSVGTAKFHAVIEEEKDCNLLIVANAQSQVSAMLGSLTRGVSKKTDVLELLEYSNEDKWKADGAGVYTNIPMMAETGKIDISVGMKITNVGLVRMLSRIDVKITGVPAQTFELENIYLCNYNTNGRIAPAWDGFGALSPGVATSPNLPASVAKKLGSVDAIKYEAAGLTSYLGEIYTFEANRADDSNGYDDPARKDAPCIIVEGKYNQSLETSFYRIDFTYDETKNGNQKGTYMPLLRNHLYEIDIIGVGGEGYPSIDDALDSYMVHSNIDFNTMVYDEGLVKDIVFNGRYMLGVDKGEFLFYSGRSYDGSEEASKLMINTNEPDGWKITISDSNDKLNPDWLKVTTYSGNQGTTRIGIISDVTAADKAQTGYVDITAGRLTKRVKYYSVDPMLDFVNIQDGDVVDFGTGKHQLYTVRFITNSYWTYTKTDNNNNDDFINIMPNQSHSLNGNIYAGTAAQPVYQDFTFMPSNDDSPVAGTRFSTTLTFSTCKTGDFGNDQHRTVTFERTVPAYVGQFDTNPTQNSQIPAKNATVDIIATGNTQWTGMARYQDNMSAMLGSTTVLAQPKGLGTSTVQIRENADGVPKTIKFYVRYTDTDGVAQELYVGDLIQEAN